MSKIQVPRVDCAEAHHQRRLAIQIMEIRAHKAELHRHHQREILETRAHKEYDRQKFRQGYTGARLKCKCTSNSIGVRTYVLCVCERMSESINTIYVLLVRKDLQ